MPARTILIVMMLTTVLLLQACSDLPEWLKRKPAVADATGKAVVDCRAFWPLSEQASSCAEYARSACAGPVIYMRTVSSGSPPSNAGAPTADAWNDGQTDFRVVYQCRRNVEGNG